MAQELVKKQKSYRLVELAETQLGEKGHVEMDPADVPKQFVNSAGLKHLISQNEGDCRLAMRIADQMKILSYLSSFHLLALLLQELPSLLPHGK